MQPVLLGAAGKTRSLNRGWSQPRLSRRSAAAPPLLLHLQNADTFGTSRLVAKYQNVRFSLSLVGTFDVFISLAQTPQAPKKNCLASNERPESTGVPKVFWRIARKSILFEQKT
jgi:hypothetical protein